jgi:hypothetical protein
MSRLSIDVLRSLFAYREDGELVWKAKLSAVSPIVVGSVAGTTIGKKKKYKIIHVGGKKIFAHLIVWALHNGQWADVDVDHKDGDGLNNRIDNLRLATRSQNCMNRKVRSDNASGLKGARKRKNRDGTDVWVSVIWIDGKEKYLGRFPSALAAHEAYMEAANQNFGEFARAS